MEWQALTCSTGPAGTLICNCYNGYYWTGTACAAQGLVPGFNCSLNTNYACNSNTSMTCTANQCACKKLFIYKIYLIMNKIYLLIKGQSTNYFFHTGTGVCTLRVGYMNYCESTSWCNTTVGLVCNDSRFICDCPTPSEINTCECIWPTFWNGYFFLYFLRNFF